MTAFLRHLRWQLWLRRLGQALLAGFLGALAFGLSAQAEHGLPLQAAILGGVLVFALVLFVGRPWAPLAASINPKFDADALLRTLLSEHISIQQRRSLLPQAEGRSIRFTPLAEWPVWVGLLLCQFLVAGWVFLSPPSRSPSVYGSLEALQGVNADGSARLEEAAPGSPSKLQPVPLLQDGESASAGGQWSRSVPANPSSALRQGLDFGVEQAAYQRYLRNLAKQQ